MDFIPGTKVIHHDILICVTTDKIAVRTGRFKPD